MAKQLIVLDYDAVKKAFDEEFKSTRKLIESGETHLDNLAEGFTEADRVLRKMLTVDAVKVIRCRNCIHDGLSTCPIGGCKNSAPFPSMAVIFRRYPNENPETRQG